METELTDEIRMRDAKVFSEQARIKKLESQNDAQQRQLMDKDRLLKAAKEQKQELAACQEQLRAELELWKHDLEKERQINKETVGTVPRDVAECRHFNQSDAKWKWRNCVTVLSRRNTNYVYLELSQYF